MTISLETLACIATALVAIYLCYVLLANDWATNRLDETREDIQSLLNPYGYTLYRFYTPEGSASEVRYSVHPYATYETAIPSRTMFWRLWLMKHMDASGHHLWVLCARPVDKAVERQARKSRL